MFITLGGQINSPWRRRHWSGGEVPDERDLIINSWRSSRRPRSSNNTMPKNSDNGTRARKSVGTYLFARESVTIAERCAAAGLIVLW